MLFLLSCASLGMITVDVILQFQNGVVFLHANASIEKIKVARTLYCML